MFSFTLDQGIVTLIQLAYSYWLKNYSTMQNKWIPLVNVGVALGVFTVIQLFVVKPEGGVLAAILLIITKALETAIASTGIHSALKATFTTAILPTPKP